MNPSTLVTSPLIPSKLLMNLSRGTHLLAALALVFFTIPGTTSLNGTIKTLLLSLILFSNRVYTHRIRCQLPPWHCTGFQTNNGNWTLFYNHSFYSNTTSEPMRCHSMRIYPFGIALNLIQNKTMRYEKVQSICIFKDQVSGETYRRLCLQLHMLRLSL